MTTPKRPWWQQATALVSLSAGGAVTGFAFAPKAAAADIESPSNMNIRLLALTQAAKPPPADDSTLRTAIVNVATYYLRMAEGKTPAEMEQLIWQHDSLDGVDHGESCAAFASLTLELAAQVVGQQSWVTGGTSYPWPLHKWVDARVDPNPASLQITSVLQDAEAHHRWHPLGDGYRPLPGDWVLFDGHVEVVTKYDNGVLATIGGDSLPNFSVNAHEYTGSLADDGVVGFVNNGRLAAAPSGPKAPDSGSGPGPGAQSGPGSPSQGHPGSGPGRTGRTAPRHGSGATRRNGQTDSGPAPGHASQPGQAAIPGVPTGAGAPAGPGPQAGHPSRRSAPRQAATGLDATAAIPGMPAVTPTDERQPQTRRRSAGQGAPRADRPGRSPAAHQGSGSSPTGASPTGQHSHAESPGQGSGTLRAGRPSGDSRTGPATGSGVQSGRSAHDGVPADRPDHSGPRTGQAIQTGAHTGPGSPGWSQIPGVPGTIETSTAKPGKPAQPTASHPAPPQATTPAAAAPTSAERTFIDQIAPGAMAAQRKYGVPAAVTIAQAILESGWGTSTLAAQDHNLFGIKGTGPAGGALYPTTEYVNGRPVARTAEFRVYHDVAQSMDDHGKVIADSGYYGDAMAHQHDPNAFANALTGVYATDPDYGTKLIGMMQQYHLYRYDAAASHPTAGTPTSDTPNSGTPSSGSPNSGTPNSGTPTSDTPTSDTPNSGTPNSDTPDSGIPISDIPRTDGSGTVGLASIPGLPVSVGPAPVTTPHKPTAPVSTPPSTPAPRRTPPATTAPVPTPTRSTPTPAPAPAPTTPRSSPSPTGTAPTKTAPTKTPSTKTPSTKTAPTETPSTKASPTKASPTKTAPTKASPTKTGSAKTTSPSARPPRASRPAPETVRTARLDADVRPAPTAAPAARAPRPTAPAVDAVSARRMRPSAEYLPSRRAHGSTRTGRARYRDDMPPAVRNAFNLMAKAPLMAKKSLYQDVASQTGVPWQLLAACDWMQCKADGRFSPVRGEKLGTANPDGTMYRTKSEALDQCADDLVELAWEVYEIDVPGQAHLSICDLANVFAAFRWGGLLRLHRTSAMEFPYSVAGLTEAHLHMRWPNIDATNPPDKPGAKFRMPFGAVPVVLNLNYPAVD
jgi:flagellum-specific peptidoglycan hydrolase FlgJ